MKQNNKTVFLVFFLVFLLVIIIVVQIIKTPSVNPRIDPSPTGDNQNNASQIEQQTSTTNLQIVSTNLLTEANPLYVDRFLKISFNKAISPLDIKYTLSPEIESGAFQENNPNEILIKPAEVWPFGTTYTLTIDSSTIAMDGSKLDKNYTFVFTTYKEEGHREEGL